MSTMDGKPKMGRIFSLREEKSFYTDLIVITEKIFRGAVVKPRNLSSIFRRQFDMNTLGHLFLFTIFPSELSFHWTHFVDFFFQIWNLMR